MAITLGAEVALNLHLDRGATYADLETALVDAGFTSYTITRNVNYDESADAQLYVRNKPDQNGNLSSLDAAETMRKLTDAIEALTAAEPQETPA